MTPLLMANVMNYMYVLRQEALRGTSEELNSKKTSLFNTLKNHSANNRHLMKFLTLVEKNIKEESSLYPRGTLEQIWSAFVLHRLSKETFLTYLNNLIPEIARIPESFELQEWTKDSFDAFCASYQEDADWDALFIAKFWSFDSSSPYSKWGTIIENGNCPVFDRTLGIFSDKSFQDCIETLYRHFCNFILFDQKKNSFTLPKITTPFFQELFSFYEDQPPSKVNDDSELLRSSWNRVVGDLPDVRYDYQSPGYDLQSDLLNFFTVWSVILGIQFDVIDSTQMESWIKSSFKKLINTLNPSLQEIKINLQDILMHENNQFFGRVSISFVNQYNARLSFDLLFKNSHATIQNIDFDQFSRDKLICPVATTVPQELVFSKTFSHPLYQLFATTGGIDTEGKQEKLLMKISQIDVQCTPFLSQLLKESNPAILDRLQTGILSEFLKRDPSLKSYFLDIAEKFNTSSFSWGRIFSQKLYKLLSLNHIELREKVLENSLKSLQSTTLEAFYALETARFLISQKIGIDEYFEKAKEMIRPGNPEQVRNGCILLNDIILQRRKWEDAMLIAKKIDGFEHRGEISCLLNLIKTMIRMGLPSDYFINKVARLVDHPDAVVKICSLDVFTALVEKGEGINEAISLIPNILTSDNHRIKQLGESLLDLIVTRDKVLQNLQKRGPGLDFLRQTK